ncbi:MAG: tetratricopeptide repeat protein, partial [Bryobacterales bacterium]|nr:tetratricopeptide repeat protein [Bryobacterales bacterium]
MRLWAAAAILCCLSCAKRSQAPELPQLSLDAFLPAVRSEVAKALEAARANPADGGAAGKLGMILHAHQQYGAAEACYRRAEVLDPKRPSWPYYLSAVYSQEGNNAASLDAMQRALKLDPSYAPAQLRMAELLFDAGRLDESGERYRKLSSAEATYGAGRVHAAKGETAAAIESFEKACALFPDYGAAHYALALALRKQGRDAEAQPHFARYEEHKLTVPPSSDALLAEVNKLNVAATAFIREGADLEAQGKLAEAAQAHLKALEADPRMEQAHINLISLYGRLGQPEKAAEHYRAAVALNPSRAECYYNFGVLQFSLKHYDPAREAFAHALKINPNYAEAHSNLGFLLETQGNFRDAVDHYGLAIENQPGYRLAHFHLGRILVNQRKYAESIAHFEKTLTPEDDATPGYRYALAVACVRSGNRARG